jgi:hypothetical protein
LQDDRRVEQYPCSRPSGAQDRRSKRTKYRAATNPRWNVANDGTHDSTDPNADCHPMKRKTPRDDEIRSVHQEHKAGHQGACNTEQFPRMVKVVSHGDEPDATDCHQQYPGDLSPAHKDSLRSIRIVALRRLTLPFSRGGRTTALKPASASRPPTAGTGG